MCFNGGHIASCGVNPRTSHKGRITQSMAPPNNAHKKHTSLRIPMEAFAFIFKGSDFPPSRAENGGDISVFVYRSKRNRISPAIGGPEDFPVLRKDKDHRYGIG